jgi:cyclopropane fatty-acyl-phospholipid synthase-like methyltransferase
MAGTDIPSPVDFHDPAAAGAWVAETAAARPWRADFFAAFAAALNDRTGPPPAHILELGSGPGPGHLAHALLAACPAARYTALDFSPAMHALARAHLGAAAQDGRVTFLQRDFREPDWTSGLRGFDAVVTMQAAHEVRHRRHLPLLLRRLRDTLADDGLLLFCDHYAEPGSRKNPALFFARDEQPAALAAAGFRDVAPLLDAGGMALWRARR